MIKSLFPEDMLNKPLGADMSLEGIASKLTYFTEQFHLIHWQTSVYSEHLAVGSAYDFIHDFKDDVIEKLMGYIGGKPRAFKIPPISDGVSASTLAKEVKDYAQELQNYASANGYPDIENMAQDLSGHMAKLLYLLTLS
jgi:hypothetical protein